MSEHPDPLQTAPEDEGRLVAHAPAPAALPPGRIGRYRVERLLGQGGFGLVYLAHDEQLDRPVAIKTPHARLVAQAGAAAAYLAEARTVANLDHANIVPVYDVGGDDQFPCYVVSKYIDGADLAVRLKQSRLSLHEAVEMTAAAADALHHAHKHGLVHRDVKPGNILLDKSSKPFVADFGLALREQDIGKGPRFAGTPSYMSPEQARGEGHRVDGRSDVFSLGVVLYELLTRRRPFHAESREEVLEQITNREVRPPRQWDDTIPKELERICLKALSKRASERYTTAKDMAEDLRHFLAEASAAEKSTFTVREKHEAAIASPMPGPAPTPSYQQAVKIVPKGLRSFDAGDADFFLELLPGPRDRDGLPESIRFWKARIDAPDADGTFSVGLIYGPSGCGKSSLVKAGLLPRLAKSVTAVYVEAAAEETEARLLNGLRKRCPALSDNLGLKETLAALRRGQGIPVGKKVVIVLDQFEQWLHAKKEERNTELVQALRQCDGGRVLCVVMVRDDFWMAATRFMRELEIRLLEGQNSASVDLFDLDHARKVLAAIGRAFGKVPENSGETSKDQKGFLNLAVSGLAQEGKVISVRLALFAEMVRGKSWTPATLKEVGGAEGVGVTFLEETFSAATAPPEHRYHQKAARAVLKALLPESGTDIKGHMRSHAELLQASGYANRPKDFDDLLRILDSEIRLLTPTDPQGQEEDAASHVQPGQKFYQLTHDYLVHSLREWLTRKQKETRRGRAELLLADRAAVWNARPESRQLPSLWQWCSIRWLTRKKDWTPPQRKMMRKAGRYHAVRGAVLAVLAAAGILVGLFVQSRVVEQSNADHAAVLVKQLLNADVAQAPGIVKDMEGYRKWADPQLRQENAAAKDGSRQKLNTSLALLPLDEGQTEYLYERLLNAGPTEVSVIRDALLPQHKTLCERLWGVLEDGKDDADRRFRAACALAGYDVTENDANSRRWEGVSPFVADRLLVAVQQNPSHYDLLLKTLDPVRDRLVGPLSEVFRSGERAESDRSWAANLLAEYAADRPDVLAGLLMDADEKQFAVIYPKFKEQADKGLPLLSAEVDRKPPPDMPSSDPQREKLAKRQANAAVALVRMNQQEKVWPLLMRHDQPGKLDDPRVRSYLIHRFGPLGADARVLVKRLVEEPDVTIRRALILSLGPEEFEGEAGGAGPGSRWPPEEKKRLVERMREFYGTAADPGLRAAAEWLLRQWKEEEWLVRTDEAAAKDEEGRQMRLADIQRELAGQKDKAQPRWYVNSQGQTMVVLPGPMEFLMGSAPKEDGANVGEDRHGERIGRTFAIAAKPVTLGQFQMYYREAYNKDYDSGERYTPTDSCPVNYVTWHQAAVYCNWLSKREGLPECYEIAGKGPFGPVAKLKDNYLSLAGYRLPTEAEWEYACRAGAATSRYYGETNELLGKYAWYLDNSQGRTHPVGSKKPNDFGLFDLHGNVWSWCQERYRPYATVQEGETIEDKDGDMDIKTDDSRVLRGGAFSTHALDVRSALRNRYTATGRNDPVGFRTVRTFIP